MDGHIDPPVTHELCDGIGLNHPIKPYAVSDKVAEALRIAVKRAQAEAKAAVIYGEGKHFCAGLDLAEHSEKPQSAAVQGSRRWHKTFDGIERGVIPLVESLMASRTSVTPEATKRLRAFLEKRTTKLQEPKE
jgi:enoyl-CoA hydratase/carnithine racemase